MNRIGDGIVSLLLLLALSPLVEGEIRSLKARLQGRRGPSPLQPYYDLWKRLHKEPGWPRDVSPLFRWIPPLTVGLSLTAALFMPLIGPAPLAGEGDAFWFLGLLALTRFAIGLAGFDAAGPFGALGTSREMTLGGFVEPVLFVGLLPPALAAGSTDLSTLATHAVAFGRAYPLALLFGGLGLAVAIIAELGRLPVDNPDTHLELTMMQEAITLEYGGPQLALLEIGRMVRQLLLLRFWWALYGAVGRSSIAAWIGLVSLAGIVALVESRNVKMRYLQLPRLMGTAALLGCLGVLLMAAAPGGI